jgi:hypothetical protein
MFLSRLWAARGGYSSSISMSSSHPVAGSSSSSSSLLQAFFFSSSDVILILLPTFFVLWTAFDCFDGMGRACCYLTGMIFSSEDSSISMLTWSFELGGCCPLPVYCAKLALRFNLLPPGTTFTDLSEVSLAGPTI